MRSAAYKQLALLCHPDKRFGSDAAASLGSFLEVSCCPAAEMGYAVCTSSSGQGTMHKLSWIYLAGQAFTPAGLMYKCLAVLHHPH